MLDPTYSTAFRKDLAKNARRGKDLTKLLTIACKILAEIPLPPSCEDHALEGKYAGHRDCHIEPDWILIYRKTKNGVMFVRLGTHSDLF